MQATFCQACVINPCSIPEWCSKWQEVGEERKRQRDQEFVTGGKSPLGLGRSCIEHKLITSPLFLPPFSSLIFEQTSIMEYVNSYISIQLARTTRVKSGAQYQLPSNTTWGSWHGEGRYFVPSAEALELSLAHFCSSHVRYSQQRLSVSSSAVDCILWMSPLAIVVLDVYQSQKVRESPPGHRDKQQRHSRAAYNVIYNGMKKWVLTQPAGEENFLGEEISKSKPSQAMEYGHPKWWVEPQQRFGEGRSMWGTVLGKGQEAWAVLAPVVHWGEVRESRRCWKEREMRNSWPCPWHKVAKPTPWPLSHLRVPAPCLKHGLQRGLSCLGQDSSLFCCFQTRLWAPPPEVLPGTISQKRGVAVEHSAC